MRGFSWSQQIALLVEAMLNGEMWSWLLNSTGSGHSSVVQRNTGNLGGDRYVHDEEVNWTASTKAVAAGVPSLKSFTQSGVRHP